MEDTEDQDPNTFSIPNYPSLLPVTMPMKYHYTAKMAEFGILAHI